jgi:hypothetical protein
MQQRISVPPVPQYKFGGDNQDPKKLEKEKLFCNGRPCVLTDRKCITQTHADMQLRYLVEFEDKTRTWAREADLSRTQQFEKGLAADARGPGFGGTFAGKASENSAEAGTDANPETVKPSGKKEKVTA